MFTLEESALLGRMLRALGVMVVCAIGGIGYLVARPYTAASTVSAPVRAVNGPTTHAAHHHRLRPHLTRRTVGRSSALSL
jgi:hypothetical protein